MKWVEMVACKVEDCDTTARGAQGYCSTHWDAVRLYGTLTPTFNCIEQTPLWMNRIVKGGDALWNS
jgi:hypothetical protein